MGLVINGVNLGMTKKTKASFCTVAFYDPEKNTLLDLEKVDFSFEESLIASISLIDRKTPSRFWLAWTGSRIRISFLDGLPPSFDFDLFIAPLRSLVPNFSSLDVSYIAPEFCWIEEI